MSTDPAARARRFDADHARRLRALAYRMLGSRAEAEDIVQEAWLRWAEGCAFCLDMHVKQARIHGERELRLHHLAIWRESPLFTPKERAALAWTEALTRIAHEGISDAAYAEAREQLSEEELATLTWRVAAINGWNRVNVAFRSAPGSKDKMFGLDKAGLS